MELGDYPQAEIYLKHCLFAWSGNGEVHFYLARCYRLQGKFDQANEELDECRRLNWPAESIELEETLQRSQQGEFAEVENRLLKWADQDNPDAAPVQEILANNYFARQQTSLALYWGERFLEHCPKNVTILILMGRSYLFLSNSSEALKYFRRAVEANPQDDKAKENYASALFTFKEPSKALKYYEDLASKHPDSRVILLGLARCYRALGKRAKCRPILDDLARQYPKDWEILDERGRLAQQEQKYAEAVKWLRRAVALHPYDSRMLYALSMCLGKLKNVSKEEIDKTLARRDQVEKILNRLDHLLRQEIVQDPYKPEIYYELAVIYFRINEEKQADNALLRALDFLGRKEKNPSTRNTLLDQMVQEQVAKLPNHWAPYFAAALAYLHSDRKKEALKYLKKTIAIEPKYPRAHAELAGYYNSIGDTKQSAKHARLAARKFP
jgi:tetratricopeptide (TPR) repeat protein